MTMFSKLTNRWSALLATAGVGLALVIAGCGGSSNAPHHATTVSGVSSASGASSRAKPAAKSATAGIPQHNGGDQDADNNGGPSDGDGNI
jgi:hypothetical protein